MEHAFWRERWTEGRIGFHEGKPNQFLVRHADVLGAGRRVLVPLCGKAEDLMCLAALGHRVVGIELVEDAVRAFFEEHGLVPAIDGNIYSHGAITLIAGDFFAVTPAHVGAIDALYDRAALIALPADLRPRYSAHVRSLVGSGSPGLVITLEFPNDPCTGPPFSVPEAELRSHYGDARLLEEVPENRLPERPATERCWAVTLEQR
jgi:thiopurine S-methyltransferase